MQAARDRSSHVGAAEHHRGFAPDSRSRIGTGVDNINPPSTSAAFKNVKHFMKSNTDD